ncbi:hypothetical protein [Chitinophaga nivalis]|uniref:Class I lanthipeptide n=1 Tax=Chitinophaga nivalis TaxID=2991709 RepID=A0ABT3IKK4_9BACT|nr:hypothetical protein [Chitinophaga nivalis]MCW3465841.1 hypothetical protein [Chitinophaga nivalis]MCW3484468.1 hypothetical protein [Chitinophaga nivalis]
MKKIVSKKLQLTTIKIASLTQVKQQDVKGAATFPCSQIISCNPNDSCIC